MTFQPAKTTGGNEQTAGPKIETSNESFDAVVQNNSQEKMGDPSSGPFDESPQNVRYNRTTSQFSTYNKSTNGAQGVDKQASQLTMSVINNIQGQSPSYKFHAKLLEKEK